MAADEPSNNDISRRLKAAARVKSEESLEPAAATMKRKRGRPPLPEHVKLERRLQAIQAQRQKLTQQQAQRAQAQPAQPSQHEEPPTVKRKPGRPRKAEVKLEQCQNPEAAHQQRLAEHAAQDAASAITTAASSQSDNPQQMEQATQLEPLSALLEPQELPSTAAVQLRHQARMVQQAAIAQLRQQEPSAVKRKPGRPRLPEEVKRERRRLAYLAKQHGRQESGLHPNSTAEEAFVEQVQELLPEHNDEAVARIPAQPLRQQARLAQQAANELLRQQRQQAKQYPEDLTLPQALEPPPAANVLLAKLPAHFVGNVVQVVECCARFAALLEIRHPPTPEKLENMLLSPCRLESVALLTKLHASLLRILLFELRRTALQKLEVATLEYVDNDAGCPVNALTWQELTRRYLIAQLVVSSAEAADTTIDWTQVLHCMSGDGGTILRTVDGFQSGAIFADSKCLAVVENQLQAHMPSMKYKLSPRSLDDVATNVKAEDTVHRVDANIAAEEAVPPVAATAKAEDIAPIDQTLPAWALALTDVAHMASNYGSRIKAKVEDALSMDPPEPARLLLVESIAKGVYKNNGCGPTKKLVAQALAMIGIHSKTPVKATGASRQRLDRRLEHKQNEVFRQRVFRRCRVVVRQLANMDGGRDFCRVADGRPGKFAIVVDLQTIDARLAAGAYPSAEAFYSEVQLLWENTLANEEEEAAYIPACRCLLENFQQLYDELVVSYVAKGPMAVNIACCIDEPALPEAAWSSESCQAAQLDASNLALASLAPVSILSSQPTLFDACQTPATHGAQPGLVQVNAHDNPASLIIAAPPAQVSTTPAPGVHPFHIPQTGSEKTAAVAVNELPDAAATPVLPHDIASSQRMAWFVFIENALQLDGHEPCLATDSARRQWLIALISAREYWQLSVGQRLALLLWMCDEVLCSDAVRIHLDESLATHLEFKRELRSADLSHRKVLKENRPKGQRGRRRSGVKLEEADVAEILALDSDDSQNDDWNPSGGVRENQTIEPTDKNAESKQEFAKIKADLLPKLQASAVRRERVGYDRWGSEYVVVTYPDGPKLLVEERHQMCQQTCIDDAGEPVTITVVPRVVEAAQAIAELRTAIGSTQKQEDLHQLQLPAAEHATDLVQTAAETNTAVEPAPIQNKPNAPKYWLQHDKATTTPGVWAAYETPEQLQALLGWLNPRGLRESSLRQALIRFEQQLLSAMRAGSERQSDASLLKARDERGKRDEGQLLHGAYLRAQQCLQVQERSIVKSEVPKVLRMQQKEWPENTPEAEGCHVLGVYIGKLRADLQNIEASLKDEVAHAVYGSSERRVAWRTAARRATTVSKLAASLVLLERMFTNAALMPRWQLHQSPQAPMHAFTISALAMRVYALDANLLLPELEKPQKRKKGRKRKNPDESGQATGTSEAQDNSKSSSKKTKLKRKKKKRKKSAVEDNPYAETFKTKRICDRCSQPYRRGHECSESAAQTPVPGQPAAEMQAEQLV
eukprot:jgi/Chlat1/1691/Chrsp127S01923